MLYYRKRRGTKNLKTNGSSLGTKILLSFMLKLWVVGKEIRLKVFILMGIFGVGIVLS